MAAAAVAAAEVVVVVVVVVFEVVVIVEYFDMTNCFHLFVDTTMMTMMNNY